MDNIFFTEEHEYVSIDGDIGTVGISDYAQGQLGDIVYVEMPEIGSELNKQDEAGVLESVKVASEYFSPVSGTVTEINEALNDNPSLVNDDAISDGWLFKIKLNNADELEELKNESEYEGFLADLA